MKRERRLFLKLSCMAGGGLLLKEYLPAAENGRIRQSNFHDFPIYRINETPEIEVHLLRSGDPIGGIGETGVPPIAPAVLNAIFAATGKRLRTLPVDRSQGTSTEKLVRIREEVER